MFRGNAMEKEARMVSVKPFQSDGARIGSWRFLAASPWAGNFHSVGLSLLTCRMGTGMPLISQNCGEIKWYLNVKEMDFQSNPGSVWRFFKIPFTVWPWTSVFTFLTLCLFSHKMGISARTPKGYCWGLQEIVHIECLARSLVPSKYSIILIIIFFIKLLGSEGMVA